MPETLQGVYYDPNHGACVRAITPLRQDLWLTVLEGKFLRVDFYAKRTTHPREYRALWCPAVREIHWEDGNVWKKLYSTHDA